MEQTVAERQYQEQRISQLHGQRDGTVNSSGAHYPWQPSTRSWTGHRGTSTIIGSSGGDHLRKVKAQIPVCRNNFQGTCARGTSCKFRHTDIGEHDRSRFYQSEHLALGVVANLGNSLFFTENKDNDSRTRFANAGYRSISPSRRFQSGTCYRGASSTYLHPELVRYDTPKYSARVEQKQVHEAGRVSGFGEDDRNSASRIFQGQEETNKENNTRTISIEQRSRSPCRNFLRGKCSFGSKCRRLHPVNTSQGHDKSYMQNSCRTGAFPREHRRRSPCRNFLSGKCYRGESCSHLHPSPMCDRTRYESCRTQRRDGVPATPHVSGGTVGSISRIFQNHEDQVNHGIQPHWDMQLVYQENQARSTMDGIQLASKRENMDVRSGSWSFERQRNSNASGYGGNGLMRKREVCLRFTKGRCDLGDSCRYLHGYHEFASSNGSTRPAEAAAYSSTFGVAIEHCNTVMGLQHDDIKNATQLNIFDEKGDASVLDGQKCELEVNSAGLCNFAEGNEDISLWNRPFKRRRSSSRSPLTPRNDIHCMNLRRFDSRMTLHQDRHYNVAQFQFPDRGSYPFRRPMYHANDHQSSTGAGDSINPGYCEKYGSKSVGPQRHDEVVNQVSQIASVSMKGEANLVILASRLTHKDQNEKELAIDSITADRLLGEAARSQGELILDPASSFKEKLVSSEPFFSSMSEKEGNVEGTNEKTVDVMPPMKTYSRKNIRKRGHGSVSCDETEEGANTSKQQENGSIFENIEKNVEPALATVEVSRRKLLVLDVNGLLADIVGMYPHRYKPDTTVSTKGVFKRPFCDDFLQFCFERYDVGIWSSRTKNNVTRVVNFLMKDTQNRLLFCWDQSHCTATGYNTIENREKPLVLKELKNLWDNKGGSLPWKKGYYNETNTILLDDSPYKALRNPPYTAIFPHPYTFKDVKDKSLGPGGDLRVHLERLTEAETVQKFIQENPFGQRPITKENLSWGFYAKIVGTSEGNQLEEKAKAVGSNGIQLKENANIVGTSDGSQLEEKDENC